jgi:hypothetical protein
MNLRYAIDGCLYVCLYVTKCIVTKVQMLQTSPLAQIYHLTIEIHPQSDVEKADILTHLWRYKTLISLPYVNIAH